MVAFLPFVESTSTCISRELMRYNTETVGLPPRKVASFLQPINDDLSLKPMGVQLILRSRSTNGTSSFIVWTNQPWPCTAQTWVTASSLKTPVLSW